jgi:hypothetical protein
VDGVWEKCESSDPVIGLTAMNGRLYALADGGAVLTRLPVPHAPWLPLEAGGASAPGAGTAWTVLAAGAGRLVAASGDGPLCWREIGPVTETPA